MRRAVAAVGVVLVLLLAAAIALRACGEAESPPATPDETAARARSSGPAAEPPVRKPTPRQRAAVPGARDEAADPAAVSLSESPATGRLTGRVAASGQDDVVAVGGAAVRLLVVGGPAPDRAGWLDPRIEDVPRAVAETVTSADGTFSFEVAPDTKWRVVVTHPDFAPAGHAGTGPGDCGTIEVSQQPAAVVTVDDEEGVPVADAEARVSLADGDPGPSVVVRGGSDGRIAVRPVGAPVVFTAPGRSFAYVRSVRDGEQVRLVRAYDLAGVVVDSTGAPIPGVELVLDDAEMRRFAVTAADGSFRFARVAGGEEHNVFLHRESGTEIRQVSAGDLAARLVLDRLAEIAGVVVFEDGRPAAGVDVEHAASTGPDGAFRMRVQASGEFTVSARRQAPVAGYAGRILTHQGRAIVTARPGAVTDGVRVVLVPEVWSFFRVVVTDAADRRVRSESWVVGVPWYDRRPAAEGEHGFAVGVAPGTALKVWARGDDAMLGRGSADVVTSSDPGCEPVTIRLAPPPPIRIRVRAPDGTDVPPPAWTTFAAEGHDVATMDGGRVRCPDGASFRLVVVSGGRRFDSYVSAPESEPYEILVAFPATARVRGRLVLADGRPAAGVAISLTTLARIAGGRVTAPTTEVSAPPTGADGVFVVEGAAAGTADLYGWREDGPPACARRIQVPESGDLDLGDVPAWDDVTLAGRVTVPEGESLEGVVVAAGWDRQRQSRSATCDASGRFRMRVADVPVIVLARRAGRLCAVTEVDPRRSGDVVLALRAMGDVRVRYPAAWDEAGVEATLTPRDGRFRWDPETSWDSTGDATHEVRIVGVPEGPWTVLLEGEACGAHRADVAVVAGKVTDVTVE